ncbi:MAG: phosphate signaling complex protein PhoU [Oscillospiraceae bacterium]|nr:phosphate signaling complex protein PhoU [Oscillospiraceae bacterium]
MGRPTFERELKTLQIELIDMGSAAESAIEESINAFKNYDVNACKVIIENDEIIDEMEKRIESKCLWLIAREQPIASDLRKITTALKIAAEMERIADHAVDIAMLTIRITEKNAFADSVEILQMAAVSVEMVRDSVTAYVNADLELAKNTEVRDDKVDDYFNKIKHDIAAVFCAQPDKIDGAIDYLLIAKYLERVADHAVNISEWVIFSQTGEHKNTLIF